MKRKLRALVHWLIPKEDVVEQTVKSGIWIASTKYLDRGLQLVSLVVLARLLDPNAFGLLGIALLSIETLKRFSTLGLEAAIIQYKETDVDRYLNTAWCLEIGRGALVFVVGVTAAPYIAAGFGEPRATPLIQVIGFMLLLHGLRNPATVYFKKNLDFHKEFGYKLSGSVVDVVVAVSYALLFTNVWALVFGHLAGQAARLVASYAIHGYRPRPEFDLEIAKELIGYGKWITGSSILYFCYSRIDDAVVGVVLTATSLGLYQVAYEIANTPTTEITNVVSEVMFPAYSQLQDDIAVLREAYATTVRTVTFASFPAGVGIIVVAPVFVDTVLGADWLPMVLTLQLLAIHGVRRSLSATAGPVYKALGRPDLTTKVSSLKLVVIAVTIYPATVRFGLEGAALVIVGAGFVSLPINVFLVRRLIGFGYPQFGREVTFPAIASAVMGVTLVGVRRSVTFQSGLVELGALVGTGVLAYGLVVLMLDRQFEWGLERTVRLTLEKLS